MEINSSDHGQSISVSATDKELICEPIMCPLYHYFGCEWKGPFDDLMLHCISKHEKYVTKGYTQYYEIKDFDNIKVKKDFPHIIQAHGNIFMFLLTKFPSGSVKFYLVSMGCCTDPAKYSASLYMNDINTRKDLVCWPYYCLRYQQFDRIIGTNKCMWNISRLLGASI